MTSVKLEQLNLSEFHNVQTAIQRLERFGFRFGRGGVHLARTMMLDELRTLLAYEKNLAALQDDYRTAIEEHNCLGKRSQKTRHLTFLHLIELYSLDSAILLFKALLYFWHRDTEGQPLLALLCSYARDPVLRQSVPFILNSKAGSQVARDGLEEYINQLEPRRFSKATLKSTAQNINSTFTQSGHLVGKAKKIRSQAKATLGSTAYALLLGYLTGARGESLFETEYAKLLDCSVERALELAENASSRGWIQFKRIGRVMEINFPKLIAQDELKQVR